MSKKALKGVAVGIAVAAAIIFASQLTSAHSPRASGNGAPGYYGRGHGMGPGPGCGGGPAWGRDHGWHRGYGPKMYGPPAWFDPQAKKAAIGEAVGVEQGELCSQGVKGRLPSGSQTR